MLLDKLEYNTVYVISDNIIDHSYSIIKYKNKIIFIQSWSTFNNNTIFNKHCFELSFYIDENDIDKNFNKILINMYSNENKTFNTTNSKDYNINYLTYKITNNDNLDILSTFIDKTIDNI